MSQHVETLIGYTTDRYPQFVRGVKEAMAVHPTRFEAIAEMYLGWAMEARGPSAIQASADAFVQFTTDVNLAQARYEATGAYEHHSFEEVYRQHYNQDEAMQGYLWGIYLTNFLWPHHLEICLFFRDRFLRGIGESAELVEIAPGHGGWGIWALSVLPKCTLRAYDVSRSSIQIAGSLATAAGISDRVDYEECDALDLVQRAPESADAGICCFLLEHLENPEKLFRVIHHLLRPGGRAFLTGALTAAQIDHIYEFRKESELVLMAEEQGLRVVETLSASPKRLLPKARFVPRSMALIVEKGCDGR